ncbi:Ig domain-containing protein [Acanthopleuribacter pedis]|uniref:Uncharacterized protein n=1 Tax=Acanthopleuribacter pedis TaxID=442870 RepID=A0A8J7QJE3_9BACT|nr:Ig domain-containing protein [Acanthopleuribacter pedis]MBO1321926.1 hypothetical protein [Acanthopleuribacter pedis]
MRKTVLSLFVFGTACLLWGQDNQPPVITPDPGDTVRRPGEAFIWDAYVHDPDGDSWYVLNWSRPSWMSRSCTREFCAFTGHPTMADVGKHQVLLEVADEHGATAKVEFTIRVTQKKAVADFDNDRATDFVYRLGDDFYFQPIGKPVVRFAATNMPEHAWPMVGHFDWDTRADLAIWNPDNGEWHLHLSTEDWEHTQTLSFGLQPTDMPFVGDVNGDQIDELIIRRWVNVNDGRWYVKEIGQAGYKMERFGGYETDIPMIGDFDGDLRAEMAIKRLNTRGEWYFKGFGEKTHTGPIYFGVQNSDRVCPADYDGDDAVDPALRRLEGWLPGHWYARLSSTDSNDLVTFGQRATDIEVPGDYNGDGNAERAIYRPSTGEFIVHIDGENHFTRIGPAWNNLVPLLAPSTAKKDLLRN